MCTQDVPLPLSLSAFPAPCDNQQHALTLSTAAALPRSEVGNGVLVPLGVLVAQEAAVTLLRSRGRAAQLGQTPLVMVTGRSWDTLELLVQAQDLPRIPTNAARDPALMMKALFAASSCKVGFHPCPSCRGSRGRGWKESQGPCHTRSVHSDITARPSSVMDGT